jgi:methionyl-tRNA formyltransferase
MRIVFMGSAELAVPSLRALLDGAADDVVGVVSQPDRPSGRNRKLSPCPLKAFAESRGLNVMTPAKVGAPESLHALERLTPDLFVVVAYGQYIPSTVIQLACHEAINVHPSLLPKYRGAAPIQWAILNGDQQTGVSIIYLAKKMDAGDILRQECCPIEPDDTSALLHDRLAELGADLLLETIDDIRNDRVSRTVQNEADAVEISKLAKEDGKIDWSMPAETIRNRIRAFDPWPGSYCVLPDGDVLKVWKAGTEAGEGTPGELLDGRLLVATGSQALRLLEVQPAGRKRMPADAFRNGYPLKAGDKLS